MLQVNYLIGFGQRRASAYDPGGSASALTTAAGAVDAISGYSADGANVYMISQLDFS